MKKINVLVIDDNESIIETINDFINFIHIVLTKIKKT